MTQSEKNSADYWEWRFEGDWASQNGCEQTRYFAQIVLENLPCWLAEEIQTHNLSLCDWGCAEGEAVDSYRKHFPFSRIVGIDRSRNAIRKAQAKFGERYFLSQDILSTPPSQTFDVLFTSNVLEHFEQPWPVLETVGRYASRHLVVLVPFREENRIPEHVYTFDDATVFSHVDPDFALSFFKVIDCSKREIRYWPGFQILLVFSRAQVYPEFREIVQYMNFMIDADAPVVTDGNPVPDAPSGTELLSVLREEVAALRTQMEQVIGRLAEANRSLIALAEANRSLSRLADENRSLTRRCDVLSEELEAATELSRTREAELAERATACQRWQGKAMAFEAQLNDQADEMGRIRAAHEDCAAENQTLKLRISADAYEVASLRRLVSDLQNSLSWRITSPLRFVSRPFFYAVRNTAAREMPGPRHGAATPADPLEPILSELRRARSIAVVTCAVPYGSTLNQRPICCARYLADSGWTVLFIVWQWSRNEEVPQAYQQVAPGIFQLPLHVFQENTQVIAAASYVPRSYVCTLPSPGLVAAVQSLRSGGYHIHYDIMDDWEEFHRYGEAPWFCSSVEQDLVNLSDSVTAVSPKLAEKFGRLRSDIAVVRNGYAPAALQCEQFIAARAPVDGRKIVGYFGHLSDAWFDWGTLFYTAGKLRDVDFELIGTGLSKDSHERLKEFPNIRFIGPVAQSRLHRYTERWRAGMIPFQPSALSAAVDPLKIYEYLHFGLHTVVTGINGIADYPLVHFAADTEGFAQAIANIPEQPDEQQLSELADFLKTCVWEQRLSALKALLSQPSGLPSLYAR